MASTAVRAARRAVDTLAEHGVRYVFGVPGAKIDAVYDALADGGPQLVVCRHEQNAALMAAAVGRLTGVPGAAVVTSGPGTTNLLTGLLTANTEQYPAIAICGAVPRRDRLKRTHQSMDAAAVLGPCTKYTGEVNDPDNVPEAIANALRAAMTEPRGAAAVVLPADVAAAQTTAAVRRPAPVPPLGPAPAAAIDRAAALIRDAERPVLLAGLRAADPAPCAALRDLLRATGLPVVETFQAAGVVSRELDDQYLGRVGLFRNQPGDVLIARADVLVTVGYDAVEYDPGLWNTDPGRTVVHIDALRAGLDNHYQPAIELRGDIAATVTELGRRLSGQEPGSPDVREPGSPYMREPGSPYVREPGSPYGGELGSPSGLTPGLPSAADAASNPAGRRRGAYFADQRRALAEIDQQDRNAEPGTGGLNPAAVVLKLNEIVRDDATVVSDVGSHYIYMARHFRAYEPRHLLFSNGQQTLGVALPWAMAASLVRPGTQVVSVSGDGGFLFTAQELETATRLGLRLTHVIMRDNRYDMVAFQEILKYGRTSGVQLGDYDITHYAAAFGARGVRVATMDEFEAELRQALAPESLPEPGVTIIDVRVDYSHNTGLFASLHDGVLE